jgi:NAD(P)H-nitrite reductase large subunit
VIAVHGDTRVEAATVARIDSSWRVIPATERTIECDAVCLGHGLTPRLEAAVAAGCTIAGGFVAVDADQRTSVPGIFAAGEITAIGGVDHALATGAIAGHLAAGGAAGDILPAFRQAARAGAFATRLAAAHAIKPGWQTWPRDDTIICRCENVTLGALRTAAQTTQGDGLRAAKLVTRAGLGLCQGRICGHTVEAFWLAERGLDSFADEASFDRRPILAPITLGDLARADAPQHTYPQGALHDH